MGSPPEKATASVPQVGQAVEPPDHLGGGHWVGDLVVLVAVSAVDVAAAHGDDLREQRMLAMPEPPSDEPGSVDDALQVSPAP